MIFNILLLLVANVLIPYFPAPPQIFLAYCGYEYNTKQVTIYDDMNLTRHYNQEDFRKSFRQSLKKHHPDRGGSQQSFARIKGIKQIMEQQINYYDLYNITAIDLKHYQSIDQVAQMKQLFYGFETAIFYFISLLYFIAFTIDDKLRPSRKILLPLTIGFCCYDFLIHQYPNTVTIFDMVDGKIPLFMQSLLLKRVFCILTAIIRTRTMRRKNEEQVLIDEIKKLPLINSYQPNYGQASNQNKQSRQEQKILKQVYIKKLMRLSEIQNDRVKLMQQNEKSWGTRIKNWISKGFSYIIFGVMIWGIVSSMMSSQKTLSVQRQF